MHKRYALALIVLSLGVLEEGMAWTWTPDPKLYYMGRFIGFARMTDGMRFATAE